MLWVLCILCGVVIVSAFLINSTLYTVGNRIVHAIRELQGDIQAVQSHLRALSKGLLPDGFFEHRARDLGSVLDQLERQTELLQRMIDDGIGTDAEERAHKRRAAEQFLKERERKAGPKGELPG